MFNVQSRLMFNVHAVIGTGSMATLGKLLRDGVGLTYGLSPAQTHLEQNYTEFNVQSGVKVMSAVRVKHKS